MLAFSNKSDTIKKTKYYIYYIHTYLYRYIDGNTQVFEKIIKETKTREEIRHLYFERQK